MDMHHLELDVACYSHALYHEINTGSLQEKLGVYNVIRNRVRDGRWGRDVCSVVYANNQFAVQDERHNPVDKVAFLKMELFVLDAMRGKYLNPVADALYFHDDSMQAKDKWFGKRKKTKIGRMVFY